jgi:hypothetical protein
VVRGGEALASDLDGAREALHDLERRVPFPRLIQRRQVFVEIVLGGAARHEEREEDKKRETTHGDLGKRRDVRF